MLSLRHGSIDKLLSSSLYDQDSFYQELIRDTSSAKSQVLIESPFITAKRTKSLLPVFKMLTQRGVRIVINTKTLDELELNYCEQASRVIGQLQDAGVDVLLTVGHHRKLAVIDRQILWEGSLNILSQNDSCEIMRRIDSAQLACEMLEYVGIVKWI